MKKYIILFCCCIGGLLLSSGLKAQVLGGICQPLTWEQASMMALRENKLVFVKVVSDGNSISGKVEKLLSSNSEIRNFLQRNAIAIQIDMGTPAGTDFAPRLMMNMYPVYAFFMPYGDLLTIVSPRSMEQRPALFMEQGREALKLAGIKRSNSRSVHFEDLSLDEVLTKAKSAGKTVFIDAYTAYCQPCLLMERNVFTLDKVADFYNANFINIRLDFGKAKELALKYGVQGYPAFVFVNGDGKLIFKAGGYTPADDFIGYGRTALEKARGIAFVSGTPEEIRAKAEQSGKMIFTDVYSSNDARHREMVKSVFTDPEVAELFNTHFVSVMREVDGANEMPVFRFADAKGREVHRFTGATDVMGLLREIRLAVEGKGLAYMTACYAAGERQTDFVELYIKTLDRAADSKGAGIAAQEYLSGLNKELLKEKKYWEIFHRYVTDVNSDLFAYVYAHRDELYRIFGEKQVKQKIQEVWTLGAGQFVSEMAGKYVFDEAGFKGYIKRLKKEKVPEWRGIVRNARMNAAEQTGDWRMYVELAEEKWNEEDISDAELYSWGIKINQECHDEAIRFKAARWFALAADEMERRERRSGKVNLSSYKGFYNKLVNDLVGKK